MSPGGRRVRAGAAAQLIPAATTYVVKLTRTMLDALWQIITGRRSVKELGGPLKIAQVAGQQATLGLVAFVSLRRAAFN